MTKRLAIEMMALIDPAMYGRFNVLRTDMLKERVGQPAKVLVLVDGKACQV